MNKVSQALIDMGWEFMPICDTEWCWFMFDDEGEMVSSQGDARWQRDIQIAQMKACRES